MAQVTRVPAAHPHHHARVSTSTRPNRRPAPSQNRQSVARHTEFDGVAFETFADRLLSDLAPGTVLEELIADRVVLAAWRVQECSRAEILALVDSEPSTYPRISRETTRADRGLAKALSLLAMAREEARKPRGTSGRPAPGVANPSRAGVEGDDACLSNEWTLARGRGDDETDETTEPEPMEDPPGWEDRLTVDPNVSQVSPVVRGTWVTAQQVVALVVDGWTWSDILRTHPELTEADIRACLSYTVEQDDYADL